MGETSLHFAMLPDPGREHRSPLTTTAVYRGWMLRRRLLRALTGSPFGVLVGMLLVMWIIEVADTLIFGGWFQTGATHPRRLAPPPGPACSPLIPARRGHTPSTSRPRLAVAGLVAVRGRAVASPTRRAPAPAAATTSAPAA